MTRQENDDVGSLFKAIGAKTRQFKEFGTQNNAAQAQERWPLFKTLDLEKRTPPPLLQSAEKNVWAKSSGLPAPIAPASKKTAPSLGQQIAKGLHTLGRPVAPDNPPEAEMVAPAPVAPVAPTAPVAPVLRASTRLNKTLAGTSAAPVSAPAPAPTPAASGGLFAKAKPTAPALPQALAAPTAAKGLSSRATSATPTATPAATPPKKSLFGKLGAQENTTGTATMTTNPASGNLSNLFARMAQPEPEPTKGLFGRKRKS